MRFIVFSVFWFRDNYYSSETFMFVLWKHSRLCGCFELILRSNHCDEANTINTHTPRSDETLTRSHTSAQITEVKRNPDKRTRDDLWF